MILTANDCLAKYGPPENERNLCLFELSSDYRIKALPRRLYCNRDLVSPLQQALLNVRDRGYEEAIKTWDGCLQMRPSKVSKPKAVIDSLHSWGVAIDINAAWNRYGGKPNMPAGLVKCFLDAGFDWGGHFKVPDGSHFQLMYELII